MLAFSYSVPVNTPEGWLVAGDLGTAPTEDKVHGTFGQYDKDSLLLRAYAPRPAATKLWMYALVLGAVVVPVLGAVLGRGLVGSPLRARIIALLSPVLGLAWGFAVTVAVVLGYQPPYANFYDQRSWANNPFPGDPVLGLAKAVIVCALVPLGTALAAVAALTMSRELARLPKEFDWTAAGAVSVILALFCALVFVLALLTGPCTPLP